MVQSGYIFSNFLSFHVSDMFSLLILAHLHSTRVSNELGAGNPNAAKLAVWVVLAMAVTVGIVILLLTILVRKLWGNAYSNEKEVINYIAIMMPIVGFSNFLDGIQCVLSGTLSLSWLFNCGVCLFSFIFKINKN